MRLIALFTFVTLLSGLLAIYYWTRIYERARSGSFGWVLLTVTSVFLIATPIFYIILDAVNVSILSAMLFLMSWGFSTLILFSGSGYIFHRSFASVPRSSVGRYLIEGFNFKKPEIVRSTCGSNCSMCESYKEGACRGCIEENRKDRGLCPAVECADKREVDSCLDCNESDYCTLLENVTVACPATKEKPQVPDARKYRGLTDYPWLIFTDKDQRNEDLLIDLTLSQLMNGRNVILVSSNHKHKLFTTVLGEHLEKGLIRFVQISESEINQPSDAGLSRSVISELVDITKASPERSGIILDLSRSLKPNMKELYPMLNQIIEDALKRGLQFIMVADTDMEESEKRSLRDLFFGYTEFSDDEIKVLKGRDEKQNLSVDNYVKYVGEWG